MIQVTDAWEAANKIVEAIKIAPIGIVIAISGVSIVLVFIAARLGEIRDELRRMNRDR